MKNCEKNILAYFAMPWSETLSHVKMHPEGGPAWLGNQRVSSYCWHLLFNLSGKRITGRRLTITKIGLTSDKGMTTSNNLQSRSQIAYIRMAVKAENAR